MGRKGKEFESRMPESTRLALRRQRKVIISTVARLIGDFDSKFQCTKMTHGAKVREPGDCWEIRQMLPGPYTT